MELQLECRLIQVKYFKRKKMKEKTLKPRKCTISINLGTMTKKHGASILVLLVKNSTAIALLPTSLNIDTWIAIVLNISFVEVIILI